MPPKKHIKVAARLLPPDYDIVRVTIVEQTHTHDKFGITFDDYMAGNYHMGYGSDFVHEGYVLISTTMARWRERGYAYLKGVDNGYHEKPWFNMPLIEYKRFRAAIIAYNSYFAGTSKKVPVTPVKVNYNLAAQDKKPKGKEPWQLRRKDNYYGR